MKTHIIPGWVFIAILAFAFNCCGTQKRKKTIPVTFCDTIQTYINRNPQPFTPIISNINPKFHVYTVKLEDNDYYQITWKNIGYFNKYEVWLDNIKFSFTPKLAPGSNCTVMGDEIAAFIDQRKLGYECMRDQLEPTLNLYDCIYEHLWVIKVRGIACDSICGPFSNEIQNISLQCNAPIQNEH